jgi:predicted aspartyl protease
MEHLKEYLLESGFHCIKLKKTLTNHFELKVKINNVKGRFILDTGASNSCVGFDQVERFNLETQESEHKASGAGTTEIETKISKKNKLKIGGYQLKKTSLILIDLMHINHALEKQNSNPIQGIIGADILHKAEAIIDYKKKYLFLKSN